MTITRDQWSNHVISCNYGYAIMGNAPSKKSTVRVIKKQPMSNDAQEHAQGRETTLALHEDLLGRIVKAEEKAKEAGNKASEATKEVIK